MITRFLSLIIRSLLMAIAKEHCLKKGARKQNHHQAIGNEAIGLFFLIIGLFLLNEATAGGPTRVMPAKIGLIQLIGRSLFKLVNIANDTIGGPKR